MLSLSAAVVLQVLSWNNARPATARAILRVYGSSGARTQNQTEIRTTTRNCDKLSRAWYHAGHDGMGTWLETILDSAPLPRVASAALLVVVANVLIHPIILVPIFEPTRTSGFLYRSGAELFYSAVWSMLAAILMHVLYGYSKRIKTSLREVGEIFDLTAEKSEKLYHAFTETIAGKGCLTSGLLLGVSAALCQFYLVVPTMVASGWYVSEAIHIGSACIVFFNYMLIGSAIWMLATYVYVINGIRSRTSQLPPITRLDRFKIFGVTSLHGAIYFTAIGILALAYFLGTKYLRISWAPGVLEILITFFAALFPALFFFGSLLGIHRSIVEVKEAELQELRTEYWRRHQEFQRLIAQPSEARESEIAINRTSMRELDNVARWVESIREWPFDLGILRTLLVSVVFPLVTYLLGNLLVGVPLHL